MKKNGNCDRPPVSAVVITFNEEDRLSACLSSLDWVEEIVVVDSCSTDATCQVASRFTDRILEHPFENFAAQKKWAVEQVSHNWVLNLDADEALSPSLVEELKALPASVWEHCSGIEMPISTNFFGRGLKFGGWYPNYHLRCFRKDSCRFNELPVHESILVEGTVHRLRHPLLHRPYRNLAHYLEKVDRYSTLAAGEMFKNRKLKEVAAINIALRPAACFLRRFILQLGFLDGFAGLVANGFHVMYVFLKYAKIWEMKQRDQGCSGTGMKAPGNEP